MAAKHLIIKKMITNGKKDLRVSGLSELRDEHIEILRKSYVLDLSSNGISHLPPSFSTLITIRAMDLGQNKLTELPDNFGDLVKLKYLNLRQNKLEHLPQSFRNLKQLIWLNLRDNPLLPTVALIAGPCLDLRQCLRCAENVVNLIAKFQWKIKLELAQRHRDKLKQLEMIIREKQHDEEKAKIGNQVAVPQETKSFIWIFLNYINSIAIVASILLSKIRGIYYSMVTKLCNSIIWHY